MIKYKFTSFIKPNETNIIYGFCVEYPLVSLMRADNIKIG